MNRDIEGDIGELIADEEEDDREVLDEKELLDELGDEMFMIDGEHDVEDNVAAGHDATV